MFLSFSLLRTFFSEWFQLPDICHDKGFDPFPSLPWVMSGYVWCLQVKLVSHQSQVRSNSHSFLQSLSPSPLFSFRYGGDLRFLFCTVCLHKQVTTILYLPNKYVNCIEISMIPNTINKKVGCLACFLPTIPSRPRWSCELWGFSGVTGVQRCKTAARSWIHTDRQGLNMLVCAIHVMIKYEYGEASTPSCVRGFALRGAIANE